jgi:hypothetical protein
MPGDDIYVKIINSACSRKWLIILKNTLHYVAGKIFYIDIIGHYPIVVIY